MIFAKKLCFQDMPYQPAPGEVIINYYNSTATGTHIKDGILYQRGRYKVELAAGLPYSLSLPALKGISIITEMAEPFYIDAYIGGNAESRRGASSNPYSGAGKANCVEGPGAYDGIFGGAGGAGRDQGVAYACGGGNAVGDSIIYHTGINDCTGSAGSACWFVAKGKEVGSLTSTGEADAYRCFHCGGHGGYSPAGGQGPYIWGGGGGAYGGGAGGSGYSSDSYVGGNGAGGSGGNLESDGNGIGAGRADGQGGLAYFDGEKWTDVLNSMQSGDGLGYNGLSDIGAKLRITYLGGSETSEDYIDCNAVINSGGLNMDENYGCRYVGFFWDNNNSHTELYPNELLDVSEAGQYTVPLRIIKKGTVVRVALYCWFDQDTTPSDNIDEYIKITYNAFTASDSTTEINVDANVRQLTFGLKTGALQGMTNCGNGTGIEFGTRYATVIYGDSWGSAYATMKPFNIPTTMPETISVQNVGINREDTRLVESKTKSVRPLNIITEGMQTRIAVEPWTTNYGARYIVDATATAYYWTVTYYLQTVADAGALGGTVETVDNGLLSDSIETENTQGALPDVGIW